LGRQTDGLRRVVSNHAIFDRYLGFHFELLSTEKRTKAARDGQGGAGARHEEKIGRLPG
jgi:hypothetical protein